MKIGIIGWYGHRNIGDDRILYCLKKNLEGHELLVFGGWTEARKAIDKLNKCDYVLIGGGGLILRGCSLNIPLIEQIKVPFSCIGISVEADHREMYPFLELLKERAERIIVRDLKSAEIFGDDTNVEVAPDLTFLSPFEVVFPSEDPVCGLNLRPWYFWRAQLHGVFHRFMIKQSSYFPGLINYYPLVKWNVSEFVPEINRYFAKIVPIPFYFEEYQENDLTLMENFFCEVPNVFYPDSYNKIRYMVGMRFHSIVFSLQTGIPFISLSYQPKNLRFCQEIGFSELSVDIYKWREELPKAINFVEENYKEIRQAMLHYREYFYSQSKNLMDEFFGQLDV